LCGVAALASVILALQSTRASAQARLASVQGVPLRRALEMAHAADDGTNLPVLPIVRLGTTERLYVRGADLAIINSGACSLLVQAERLECLEKLSRDITPPPRPAVSPRPD
jgi:hypothetical protein